MYIYVSLFQSPEVLLILPAQGTKKKTSEFVKKCARLAWLMRVQTPPMHIEDEPGEYNEKKHERIGGVKGGKFIEIMAWPCLYKSKQRMANGLEPDFKGRVFLTNDKSAQSLRTTVVTHM